MQRGDAKLLGHHFAPRNSFGLAEAWRAADGASSLQGSLDSRRSLFRAS
jgi:hypothetical protein